MSRAGLTVSILFEAQSANYGESMGNISQLKKMTKGDGQTYTYISRQALLYNIRQQMACDNTPVDNSQNVVQFAPEATVADYPEIDLFGYMKTKAKEGASTRSAVVRVSNAVALEPFASDLDFLTNMGLAHRGGFNNAIAQSEIHNALYQYTITADLDRVGIDTNNQIEIAPEEKAARMTCFLDTVAYLYRDIKGRRENLAPIFAVGGRYVRKNPYFEGRIELLHGGLNIEMLRNAINGSEDSKTHTLVGFLGGKLRNSTEVEEIFSPLSIGELFEKLKQEVQAYYAARD